MPQFMPVDVPNPLESLASYHEVSRAMGLFPTTKGVEVLVPTVELISPMRDGEEIMRFLEGAIRTAYKSEDKIGPDSHKKILSHILSLKHESTLEHVGFTFRIVTCRGVTHELVRHRLASYTQESTRYVSYGKRPPQAILPWHLLKYNDPNMNVFWHDGMVTEFGLYIKALEMFKWKPQEARGFLPNDCKTEIVTTMNLRSLRHFCGLRTPGSAHPDMQVIAREVLRQLYEIVPVLFEDIWTASRLGIQVEPGVPA